MWQLHFPLNKGKQKQTAYPFHTPLNKNLGRVGNHFLLWTCYKKEKKEEEEEEEIYQKYLR